MADDIPPKVTAPCAHFGTCGGCSLQDMSEADMARMKQDRVLAALRRQGIAAEVRGYHASPPRSRRRAVLSGRRTKKTTMLGFFGRASDVLVNITDCHVIAPEIQAAFPKLHELVRLSATRTSVVRLTVVATPVGLDVALGDARELTSENMARLPAVAGGFARLSWNGEVVLQRAAPSLPMGRAQVVPPPGGFLQATPEGEAALVAAVGEAVAGARRVVDLFAGCGTFTLPLAAEAEIHAVEGDATALAALDRGWRGAEGLRRVTTEARDLFRRPLLAAEFKGFEAAVIDPPRAGAAAQVAEIGGSAIARIGFVSCNPATFARDMAVLAGAGFHIDWLDVVDQFRWSDHVELVAGLSR